MDQVNTTGGYIKVSCKLVMPGFGLGSCVRLF
jgi:hypothetical protein